MRLLLLAVSALLLAPAAHAQDPGGISSSSLSRCAAKVGMETRADDPAFGILFLDGMPWMLIEPNSHEIGSVRMGHTLTSTGMVKRKDGTYWPFRFTCLLDAKGHAVLFHSRGLLSAFGDQLSPSRHVAGAARLPERLPVERGTELRVQLLDLGSGEVVGEQIVRSGWFEPIPFAIRVPLKIKLEGRKLGLTARVVVAEQVMFELPQPRSLPDNELTHPHFLDLQKIATARR
jgi:hypothetical protein